MRDIRKNMVLYNRPGGEPEEKWKDKMYEIIGDVYDRLDKENLGVDESGDYEVYPYTKEEVDKTIYLTGFIDEFIPEELTESEYFPKNQEEFIHYDIVIGFEAGGGFSDTGFTGTDFSKYGEIMVMVNWLDEESSPADYHPYFRSFDMGHVNIVNQIYDFIQEAATDYAKDIERSFNFHVESLTEEINKNRGEMGGEVEKKSYYRRHR